MEKQVGCAGYAREGGGGKTGFFIVEAKELYSSLFGYNPPVADLEHRN
jgi:hypothetical protein